ncbi:U-scoloptoxin(01)-Cw1a-like [Penaeus chinensis]|uniref:U-scoloptoxin(01)-Cw1a-like n=1 Tax=Penaeus chinensis TaxID=139456 RepID=UPI001FB69E71|nr:U-scoloptoxin(01)-Cw1a-like [Penaeus chinensis]
MTGQGTHPSLSHTMKIIALALVLGVAAALPGLRLRRDSSPLRFELPSNASLVLGGINTGFDCAELPYGYYADTSNDCALFHVCLPYIDNNVYITRHFSFMCGEGTMFDQERLVCDFPQFALPCSEAAAFRKSNEYFGRSDVNFLEK